MPLNASQGTILYEIMNVELKDVGLDVPKPLRTRNDGRDQSKYCRYLHAIGHDTVNYFQLKNAIGILTRWGKLDKYARDREGNYKPRYDRLNSDKQIERSRSPNRHQIRGRSRECSSRYRYRTPEREVENYMQTIHQDGYDSKHKSGSPHKRLNSPHSNTPLFRTINRVFI